MNVRSDVLSKPGRLDDGELAEVRAHPVEGAWLIAGVPSLAPALPYVLFHHERWDGSGYPTRRPGIEIPLEGRLLAVADSFDAMTSSRPYCDARAFDGAVAEVERCSGSQFDPDYRRRIRRPRMRRARSSLPSRFRSRSESRAVEFGASLRRRIASRHAFDARRRNYRVK